MCETLGVLGLWPVSQLVICNIGVNRRTRGSYINFQHKQYTQVRSPLHPYHFNFSLSNLRLKLSNKNIGLKGVCCIWYCFFDLSTGCPQKNLFQRSDYTFSHVFLNPNFEPVPSKHVKRIHSEY